MMCARCINGVPSTGSIGWSAGRRCNIASSLPFRKRRGLWAFVGLRRSSGFHSPTATLEQMQERLHSIAQDTIHPEQELREKKMCHSSLACAAEGHVEEKAPDAAAE